jgi:6-phosphogluconolactonase (cycloisomerase 2 family)
LLSQKAGTAGCIVDEPAPNITGCANTGRALSEPTDVVVSPDGAHVYVAAPSSSAVAVFDRDLVTGVLEQKDTTDGCVVDTPAPDVLGCDNTGTALSGAFGLALDGPGTTLYIASADADAIAVYDRDTTTGALAVKAGTDGCIVNGAAPTIPIGGCDNTGRALRSPRRIAVSPDDASVYAIAAQSGSIVTFDRAADGAIDQKADPTGCLVNGGFAGCTTVRAMNLPQSLAVLGTSVYVAATGSNAVAAFDRAGDGTLTQAVDATGCVVDEPSPDVANCANTGRGLQGPLAVKTSLDGRNVYASGSDDDIAVFDRDSTTGDLAQKAGAAGCLGNDAGCAPAVGIDDVNAFTASLNGRALYGVGSASDAVLAFRRDVVPTCANQSTALSHNQASAFTVTCTDLNTDPVTVAIATPPAHGTASLTGNRVTYTPAPGYSGPDSLTFIATANGATSDPATATIEVLPGGAPVCAPRSQPVQPAATTPLALTCAAGGDPFTMAVATPPANGALGDIDQATGLVPYTPTGAFAGPDSFTYNATSAFGTSAPATYALDVFAPPADKLALALFQSSLKARSGKRVKLRYVSTLRADVTLVARRGKKVVARKQGAAKVGANSIALRAGKPGLYKLRLTAVNGDQTARRTASLRVTKKR